MFSTFFGACIPDGGTADNQKLVAYCLATHHGFLENDADIIKYSPDKGHEAYSPPVLVLEGKKDPVGVARTYALVLF